MALYTTSLYNVRNFANPLVAFGIDSLDGLKRNIWPCTLPPLPGLCYHDQFVGSKLVHLPALAHEGEVKSEMVKMGISSPTSSLAKIPSKCAVACPAG